MSNQENFADVGYKISTHKIKQIESSFHILGVIMFIIGGIYCLSLIINKIRNSEKLADLLENTFVLKAFEFIKKSCIFVFGYFIKQTAKFIDNIFGKHFIKGFERGFSFLKQCTGFEEVLYANGEGSAAKQFASVASKCSSILGIIGLIFFIVVMITFIFSLATSESDYTLVSVFKSTFEGVSNKIILIFEKFYSFCSEVIGVLGHKWPSTDKKDKKDKKD